MSFRPLKRPGLLVGLALILSGCGGSPATQDKENAQKERSLFAEWALLAESHQAGRLNETYYRRMRDAAEKELTALATTAPRSGSAAGGLIGRLAQLRGEPPVVLLHARAAAAEAIENGLEGH
jgi:hypothetical protein